MFIPAEKTAFGADPRAAAISARWFARTPGLLTDAAWARQVFCRWEAHRQESDPRGYAALRLSTAPRVRRGARVNIGATCWPRSLLID